MYPYGLLEIAYKWKLTGIRIMGVAGWLVASCAGRADAVGVYTDGKLVYILSYNLGLGYAGLTIVDFETGEQWDGPLLYDYNDDGLERLMAERDEKAMVNYLAQWFMGEWTGEATKDDGRFDEK